MICVVLVNYNGKKYNKACIDSILKSDCKERIEILVVDNASTDNSMKELENLYAGIKEIHIIRLEKNYGFSKANNEGIRWAMKQHCSYIMLLNNDTEIESWTIEKMVNLQRRTGHIIVPKILYADKPDTIWCAGGELSDILKKPKLIGNGKRDQQQFNKENRCTFANGCCMLLSDQIIERIGLLDERFFLYYEDTEYSMRANSNGVGISYCDRAVVYHKVNGSTGGNGRPENAYYITRNWLMYSRIYLKDRFVLFCIYFFLNRLCWALLWTLQRKPDMVKAVWMGIKDFKNGKSGKYEDFVLDVD